MHTYGRATSLALVSLALAGCAGVPLTQPLSRNVAPAIQPVELKIGVSQPELYADFELSRAGQTAGAACGAVPGLGILLAAACGGIAGAMDASINASRAKAADETIRPLKDEIVDLKFDQLMSESVSKSLRVVPGMQLADVAVTKTVNDKAYEESFRASTSNAVMFVNVDYHLSKDFSTLQVLARGLVYPRSATARTAAGLSAVLPAVNSPPAPNSVSSAEEPMEEPVLSLKNTVYRASVIYQTKLPIKAEAAPDYIAAWKADGARLLRAGLQDGITQVSRLLSEDLQRAPEAARPVLAKVDLESNVKADLLAESHGGKLFRLPDGSLRFNTTVFTNAASAATAEPTKATASTSTGKTAAQ